MVTSTVYCPHCGSEEVTRNGRAPNGKQKFRCRVCKKQSRENPTPHAYHDACLNLFLHRYNLERAAILI